MTMDTSFFRSEIWQEVRAEVRAEGRAEGEAKSILRIMDNRKIAIPDDVRNRIATCTDHDQLNLWLDRPIDAETVDDLFA